MQTRVRPKYLTPSALLFEIRLPLPGWISILHRVSGLLLVLACWWLVGLLKQSLASEEGFEAVRSLANAPLAKLALVLLVWAYSHHFFAGLRFLAIDLDKGVELRSARRTSAVVLAASLACTAYVAGKLWL